MFSVQKTIQFTHFQAIEKPSKFTYPFCYTPHPWVEQAAKALQNYLENQKDFSYAFGFDDASVGKMFGVLIVENQTGEIGYLAAFSGKINENNQLPGFVPPIYDVLNPQGFYKQGEERLNQLNHKIQALENAKAICTLSQAIAEKKATLDQGLNNLKATHKKSKAQRKLKRQSSEHLNVTLQQALADQLDQESQKDHFEFKDYKRQAKAQMAQLDSQLQALYAPIDHLKMERKSLSAKLQKQVHQSYVFLNAELESKVLPEIFDAYGCLPPAGAGECAAPRLLQYAYQNQLKPLAMGEFWWGASPPGQLRKHQQFYPACKSKCQPILGFMLEGLTVEKNPIIQNIRPQSFQIIYEDSDILVVNKPAGMLCVPGKTVDHSLQTQLQQNYPKKQITMVHRLDMATSGLVIAAKNAEAYKNIQQQFAQRTVHKKYTAILEGTLKNKSGKIDLPLRVDLDNRPMQMICSTHGKHAITYYKVIEEKGGKTRVLFYPYTGRTHQLRIHAAHSLGLNSPIVGDLLYGKAHDRLLLHATSITFQHPTSRESVQFDCKAPF